MTNVQQHLALLGHKVKDKVTGLEGVCSSISFDLYGCIQATLDLGFDKDGKRLDQYWMDVCRLNVISEKPVMTQPDYVEGPVAEGHHGPADKPAPRQ